MSSNAADCDLSGTRCLLSVGGCVSCKNGEKERQRRYKRADREGVLMYVKKIRLPEYPLCSYVMDIYGWFSLPRSTSCLSKSIGSSHQRSTAATLAT